MKKQLICLTLVLVQAGQVLGQSKFNITGTVIEKGSNQIIQSATVQLLKAKDSVFVAGNNTNERGVFRIPSVDKGKYIVKVSFIGYQTNYIDLNLANKKEKTVDIGYLTLADDAILLKAAQVTAQAAKVQSKGDSLIYNAAAYRLPEGSTLEALVRRLPGATVDNDGTVKINGKEVKKILVDGKEFFINDKNIAMKNLPTNIIENIKAYDRKSDLSRITGIDDGEEETVLDVGVKKNMNQGWFGQISGGLGTEDRYNARANVNRFIGSDQYSLIASANNTGDRGFGGWGGWGGGGGLRQSKSLGFQLNKEIKKLKVNGNVWHNYNGSDVRTESSSQNFVNEKGAFSNGLSQSFSSSASLSSDFKLEWTPDTMTNIIFRPSFSYSRSRGSNIGHNSTFDIDPADYTDEQLTRAEDALREGGLTDSDISELVESIANTNRSRSQSYSNSVGGNAELQVNRKFNKAGRNITLRLTGGMTNSMDKQLSASSIYYRPSSDQTNQNTNRYYNTPGRARNYSVQTTYSEPIADRTYLQFSYRFNYSYTKNNRSAFIFDETVPAFNALYQALQSHRYNIAGALDQLLADGYGTERDARLSQYSEYRNMNHTVSLMLRRVREKYNFSVGVDLMPQHSKMKYDYMNQFTDTARTVFNFSPNMRLRYRFNETTSLRVNYRGRSSQPSMTSLRSTPDDSDPLNTVIGNPGLKPSFNHNLWLDFDTYQPEHQRSFFGFANVSVTQNQISNRVSYDAEKGKRTQTSENVNGNWNGSIGCGFNLSLDSESYFTLNNMMRVGYSNNVSLLDQNQYTQNKSTTKNIDLNDHLGLSYRNSWLEVGVNGSISYSHSENNVVVNSRFNTYDFDYGLDAEVTAPWGTAFSTDISMNSRRGYSQKEMNTNELLWNAQISHSFLKGRALTIALEWNDILKQQSNISRTITALARSDTRTNAIYSYGMLRVIYKLNIFGGKNANGTDNARNEWGGRGGGPGGPGPGGRPPRR